MTQRVTAQTHTLAEQGDSGVWRNGTSVDTPSGSVVFPTLGAIFSDDFGSGDMSATSVESGFAWSSLNRTSIVTQDADCSTPGNDVVIWNGAAICTDIGASGRDWSALTGKNSLRFRYPADEEMAEQRFTMDSQTELWVSFWTRVPLNFTQGSLNSKFCVIWADNYSGPVFAQWQTRPTDPATGGALIGVTDGPSSINSGEEQKTAFITVPDDRGRWMQCVHRLKTGSAEGVADGIIQLYRRWEGESSFTMIHDMQDAENQWNGAGVGYEQGYIMGWANDPYTEDTEWLMDNFEMATSNIFGV